MSISKSTSAGLENSGDVLRALEASSNWKAMLLTAASLIMAAIVMLIGGVIFSKTYWSWIIPVFFILAILVSSVGISAVGYIMMDTAKGIPQRSITDALISSIFSYHRLILSMLALGLGFLIWVILLFFVLFVCKIPGLGPTLYTVIFPLAVVISGIFIVFLFFAGAGVVSPSIWDDGTVIETIAKMWAIAKERFVVLVMKTLLLGLLVAVVGMLIFSVIFSGLLVTTSLSAFAIGAQIDSFSLLGQLGSIMMMGNTYGLSDGSGYVIAMLIGGGILWVTVLAAQINIFLLGNCIIFLGLSNGLDFSEAKKQIQSGIDEAKRRAEEAKARAEELQRQRATTHPAQTNIETHANCPACGEHITPSDLFCGNCGHKLK